VMMNKAPMEAARRPSVLKLLPDMAASNQGGSCRAEPGVYTLGWRLPQILDARYCAGQSTKVVGASPYRVPGAAL